MLKVTEWQTRQICGFVAATAGVWGDASPLLDAAGDLSLTGEPPGQAETERQQVVPQPVSPVAPDELPEMPGVPARGVTQVSEAEAGAPARTAAAEDLFRMLAPR